MASSGFPRPRADAWLASQPADPALVLVGVPSSSSTPAGSDAWRAPAALRAALTGFTTFDGERGVDLGRLGVTDLGDWDVAGLDRGQIEGAVRRRMAEVPRGTTPVFVGGDNAVTRPLVQAIAAAGRPGKTGVLVLDSHPDVDTLEGGPTNANHLRGLVVDGLPDGYLVHVGSHSFGGSAEDMAFCEEHDFEVVTMESVDEVGAAWVVASALNDLAARCDGVYVDIDLNVLDVAFAPGCAGAQPGGMTPRQLAAAAREAGRHPAVLGADLVEVDPTRDPTGVTVLNLANAFLSFAGGLAMREAA